MESLRSQRVSLSDAVLILNAYPALKGKLEIFKQATSDAKPRSHLQALRLWAGRVLAGENGAASLWRPGHAHVSG